MTKEQLVTIIKKKKSFLCIGLDSDITKIPMHLLSTEDPIFEFNKQIIDATKDLCIAYKPNTAFYESQGVAGWASLEKTIFYINETCKDIFTIADAKRGDIGNTSAMYAKTFFEKLNVDAVTIAPYMGEDSIKPFLEYKNKWAIVLALTSNKGAFDFQTLPINSTTQNNSGTHFLYEEIIEKSKVWGTPENTMYVVGATKAEMLREIRKIIPEHFLLVPGIGAQGGSLKEVAKYGMNKECSLIVNSSRGIIYASNSEDFSDKARKEAQKLQQEMQLIVEQL